MRYCQGIVVILGLFLPNVVECIHLNIFVRIGEETYCCFGTNVTPRDGNDMIILEGNDVDILREGKHERIVYHKLIQKIKKMNGRDRIWVQLGNGASVKKWYRLGNPSPEDISKEMCMGITWSGLEYEYEQNQLMKLNNQNFREAKIIPTGHKWIVVGKNLSTLQVVEISNYFSTSTEYKHGVNCGIVELPLAETSLLELRIKAATYIFLPKDPAAPRPTTEDEIQTIMKGTTLNRITAKNMFRAYTLLNFEAVFRSEDKVAVEFSLSIWGVEMAKVNSFGIISDSSRSIHFYNVPLSTMAKKINGSVDINTWDDYKEKQEGFDIDVTIQLFAKANEKEWPKLKINTKPLTTITEKHTDPASGNSETRVVGVLEYEKDLPFPYCA